MPYAVSATSLSGFKPGQGLFGAHDHGLGRGHLVVGAGRSGFHVHDDRVFDVDQVIEPVTKLLTCLLAFAVQAEHGSTGEIAFGTLRSASGSSSSRLRGTRPLPASDVPAPTSRSRQEPCHDNGWYPLP